MRLPGVRVLASSAVVVLVLGACTAGSNEPAEEDDRGPFLAHVAGELGDAYDDIDRVLHDRTQELIAQCMGAAGWEYTPVPWENLDAGEPVDYEKSLLEHGWGVVPGNLVADEDEELPPPDPNEEYAASLSEDAHQQYWHAWYGVQNEAGDGFEPGQEGCSWNSGVAAWESSPVYKFESLITEMRQGWGKLDADAGYREAMERWRECMADAGHAGVGDDPYAYVEAKYYEEFPLGVRYQQDDPRIAELAAWEREVARSHIECSREAGVAEAADAVIYGWEREVMERRSDEVEAYVAALQEQAAG